MKRVIREDGPLSVSTPSGAFRMPIGKCMVLVAALSYNIQ